ncbi:MAG: TVP38/TMEM64 family protein [Firmicutes bacterium]|nr:TVP38/TMEM64 family protein [Bacillota bacterium]
MWVILAVGMASFLAYIMFLILKKETFKKLLISFIILLFISCLFATILKFFGAIEYISSKEKLKELIEHAGVWAPIVFIVLQIVQVVFSPIPGALSIAVGAIVFGPFLGFVYSSIGIVVGSILAFLIGRLFSNKFISRFIEKEDLKKYQNYINKKGKILLPLVFILPIFPDDIICIIAGTSTMKFWYFAVVTIITRPISILLSSYFLSGDIIPFSGWGLFVWGGIIVITGIVFFVLIKYQEPIEKFVLSKLPKKKKQ